MDAVERSAALSPSEELDELFDGEPGVGDDAAERAGSQLLMVRDDGPGVRLATAQDHMAAGLAAEDEPRALKSSVDFKTG